MTKIVINEIKTYVKPADKEKILVPVKEIQVVSVGIQGPPGVSGVDNHSALDGLDGDDHTQYHNDARGDARYYLKAQVDTALATKANTSHLHDDRYYTESEVDAALSSKAAVVHTHVISNITGLQDQLNDKAETVHSHIISDVTGLQTTLDAKELASNKGIAGGYASLDGTGKVPASQLPSFVDDVLEYANLAGFPVTGESAKIYVAIDTNKTYRWSGSAYIEISASPGTTDSLTEGASNLYFTAARARSAVVVNTLAGNETTFSPSVASVVSALAGKSDTVHTHTIANVTGLQTALDGKANTSHTHALANITEATLGAIPFSNGTNLTVGNLTYDSANNRFAVGGPQPTYTIAARIEGANNTVFASGYPMNLELVDTASFAQDVGGGIIFAGNDGAQARRWFSGFHGGKENATSGNYGGYLSLHTRPNGAGMLERMRITSTGDVAIGVTSSLAKLHVQVDAASDSSLLHLRNVNSGQAGAMMYITKGTDASNIRRAQIVLTQNLTELWAIGVPRRGGSGNNNIFAIAKTSDISTQTPEFLLTTNGRLCLHGGWSNMDLQKFGVYNTTTTIPTVLIQNVAGQTAHSLVINNSSASALTFFRANGTFKPVSLANTSAENDSVYFSTDVNKLVYKDSSGTVNNLY